MIAAVLFGSGFLFFFFFYHCRVPAIAECVVAKHCKVAGVGTFNHITRISSVLLVPLFRCLLVKNCWRILLLRNFVFAKYLFMLCRTDLVCKAFSVLLFSVLSSTIWCLSVSAAAAAFGPAMFEGGVENSQLYF